MIRIGKNNIGIAAVLASLVLVFGNTALDFFVTEYGFNFKSAAIVTVILIILLWMVTR